MTGSGLTFAGVRAGAVLDGKYELIRLLGRGGMGEVYEGRHRVIGRRVAVKFLLGAFARDPDVARRFENEAKVAGGVEHENIAGVYDVGALPDATQYLVMEYLDGEDLQCALDREGPLPPARAAAMIIQACRGLEVVHRRGIVHRDLKPANLFLCRRADDTDLVKVLDFGIAKLRHGDGAATQTGAAIGTAHYMSPEQARGDRDVGTASDVYACGVILYELLSGKRPHEGDSLLEILHKVVTQEPVPLESARPGLPDALYAIVRKAMSRSPAERFRGIAELGAALAPFAMPSIASIRVETAAMRAPSRSPVETRPMPTEGPRTVEMTEVPLTRSAPRGTSMLTLTDEALGRRRRLAPIVAGGVLSVVVMIGIAAVATTVRVQHAVPSTTSAAAPPASTATSAAPPTGTAAPPVSNATTASASSAAPRASTTPVAAPPKPPAVAGTTRPRIGAASPPAPPATAGTGNAAVAEPPPAPTASATLKSTTIVRK